MATKTALDTGTLENPSKRLTGAQAVGSGRTIQQAMRDLEDEYGADVINLQFSERRGPLGSAVPALAGGAAVANQGVVPAGDFPVRLFQRDPYDDVANLKASAPAALGTKQLTTDDLEWMNRKNQQLDQFAFRRFVANLFSGADLAQRRELLKMYPQLLEEQESVINTRIDFAKELAKLRLRGPRSEGDLRLMYAISTKLITPPAGVPWDPSTWSDTAGDTQSKLVKGLFNPRRYAVTTAPAVNATDLMGNALAGVMGGRNQPAFSPMGQTFPVPGLGVGQTGFAAASIFGTTGAAGAPEGGARWFAQ